ncbi:MAG: PorV/PorQ family protein [Bacteroidetes bacterium]|nr:PorV/PorQ family protein [Bacteroidota bacterium]
MKPRNVRRAGLAAFFVGALLVAAPANAQETFEGNTRSVSKRGTTAADFLSIPVGARAAAMGNAISASVDDLTSIYWNPAGLAAVRQGNVTAEYAQWLADVDFNFFAIAAPTGAGTIGLAITSMRTPEMEVTTVDDQYGTGETFTASSYALALSLGRQLTDRFGVGASIKYVSERIWNSNAGGVAMDIGTMFVTPFSGIRLGASISNFGTKMQLTGDDLLVKVDIDPNNGGNNESNRAFLSTGEFDMPLTMRIGLAGEVFQSDKARLTLAVDALNPNNSEQYVNVGAELGLAGDLLMIRGGYSELFLADNVRSLTVGAGLNYRFAPLYLSFDYSYEVMEYFTDINRFTVSLRW